MLRQEPSIDGSGSLTPLLLRQRHLTSLTPSLVTHHGKAPERWPLARACTRSSQAWSST